MSLFVAVKTEFLFITMTWSRSTLFTIYAKSG